jgi:hypothetical protein
VAGSKGGLAPGIFNENGITSSHLKKVRVFIRPGLGRKFYACTTYRLAYCLANGELISFRIGVPVDVRGTRNPSRLLS